MQYRYFLTNLFSMILGVTILVAIMIHILFPASAQTLDTIKKPLLKSPGILVGMFPAGISIDSFLNKLFVANAGSNTVSVINLKNMEKIDIPVGILPLEVYSESSTGNTYVTNMRSNTVSVIDGKNNSKIADIPVGFHPLFMRQDFFNNILYVVNNGFKSISAIYDTSLMAKVSFNVNPSNAGYIKCNGISVPTNYYIYMKIGTTCKVNHNNGFEQISWTQNLQGKSTRTLNISMTSDSPFDFFSNIFGNDKTQNDSEFIVDYYGNFTANFLALPPPIPKENLIGLYTLAAGIFTTWFIPNISRWLNSLVQRKHMMQYLLGLTTLDMNKKKYLQEIKTTITYAYAKGKINDSHYKLLNEKILELEKENNDNDKNL